MPKTIYLVDSDATLRSQAVKALGGRGYEVKENTDGRDVVEQVRASPPDLVVLCVELPKGSGYAICSKLRKDEALKKIPVILTSAEATQKAFDDHKKLKNGRADEYLLKPFAAEELLKKVTALVGPSGGELSADDSLGLSDLAAEFGDSPSDESLSEEGISMDEVEEIAVEEDLAPTPASLPGASDVEMLESAFDRLEDREETASHSILNGSEKAPPFHPPAQDAQDQDGQEEVQAAGRDSTDVMEVVQDPPVPKRSSGSVFPVTVTEPEPPPAAPRSSTSFGGSRDKDYFQLKERLAQREKDLLRLREELTAKEKELVEQRQHETSIEQEVSSRDEEIQKRNGQVRQLQQKIDALVAGQKRTERDLAAAREEAKTSTARAEGAEDAKNTAEALASEAQSRADGLDEELTQAKSRLSELESETERQRAQNDEISAELTGVRAQLEDATGSMEELRNRLDAAHRDAEAAQEELRRRISELEEEKQRYEDRVVKAFQRLKSEEQLRDKAKKALGIALQLLDEPGEEIEAIGEEEVS